MLKTDRELFLKNYFWLVLALSLLTALSTVYIRGVPDFPGPDGSQYFAFNVYDLLGLKFGRDIINTYGPLGYLQFPLPSYGKIIPANLALLAVTIIMAASMVETLYAVGSKIRSVAFFLLCYAAFWVAQDVSLDHGIMLAFLVCVAGAVISVHQWRRFAMFIAAALLSALVLFIKFNTGVVCCLDLFLAVVVALLTRDRRLMAPALVSLVVFFVTVGSASLYFFGSPQGLFQFIKNSFAIASPYAQTVSSFARAELQLVAALIFMAIAFAFGLYCLVKKSRLAIPLALSGIPLFFAFKHAFIRTDPTHLASFPFVALVMLALCALFCKTRKEAIVLAILSSVFLLFLPPGLSQFNMARIWSEQPIITGLSGIKTLCNLPAFESKLMDTTRSFYREEKLPDSWLARLKEGKNGVDCVPFNLFLCPANSLKWCASPALQLYMVHCPSLDLLTAQHYEGARKPDFMIVEFPDLDWRHPFFTCPLSWRAIFKNYKSVEVSARKQLLLEKREKPLSENLSFISRQNCVAGQWIPVPKDPRYVLARISLQKTILGTVQELVYRTDPVFVDVSYADGSYGYFRFLPVQAASGILISGLPSSIEGLNQLFSLAAQQRVNCFQIHGPGISSFKKGFKVEFLEASYN